MNRCAVLLILVAVLGVTAPAMDGLEDPAQTRAMAKSKEIQQLIEGLRLSLARYETQAKNIPGNAYIGSEYCIACHAWSRVWRDTKHAQALRRPMPQYSLIPGKGVVADYDRDGVDDFMQGLDFNQIESAFNPYKPNAPILSYDAGRYFITIGELTMPVVITQGGTGDWKQRYLVRVPVADTPDGYSAENYVAPVQYNERARAWVAYTPGAWYQGDFSPKFGPDATAAFLAENNNASYSQKCIGCHATGIRDLGRNADGEWVFRGFPATLYRADDPSYLDYDHDGIFDLVNIGCESCHGPGAAHVLGAGSAAAIVNPNRMTAKERNDICAQCHVRVKSAPHGQHDWPYRDDTGTSWYPGSPDPIETYSTDNGGYWPDGIHSRQHHQQHTDLYRSTKPTYRFRQVHCTDCHSAHSRRQPGQLRTSIVSGTLRINTRDDNNTLCLACHAGHGDFAAITKEQVAAYAENVDHIGRVVAGHTHHPYAPERMMGLSRCTPCHMPRTATTASAHDIASHTFEPIAPEKTLLYQPQGGMPNACALSCHSLLVNLFGLGIDPNLAVWNQPFDVQNAEFLMIYYGPGGTWWDTAEKAGRRH